MSFGCVSEILFRGWKDLLAEETFGEFRFGVGRGPSLDLVSALEVSAVSVDSVRSEDNLKKKLEVQESF